MLFWKPCGCVLISADESSRAKDMNLSSDTVIGFIVLCDYHRMFEDIQQRLRDIEHCIDSWEK